mmetsp:Transcript_11859/g.29054  ORF Transcript_11859/g.29054 Transcript_11859/m.29054 type:complete len:244 (-) Transcript_11859:652-1383(-)
MMMRLVHAVSHIHVPIERLGGLQETLGRVRENFFHEPLGHGLAEAQVVDDVGNVRHVRGEVVIFRLGLDVKVSGGAIDEEEAGELASGVVPVLPRVLNFVTAGGEAFGELLVFFGLDGPVFGNTNGLARLHKLLIVLSLVLLLHRFDKVRQLHHGTMSVIIPLLLPVHKEFQGGIRPNVILHAQIVVVHAVYLPDQHGHLHGHGGLIILVAVLVLPPVLVQLILHAGLRDLEHDLREGLPRRR